MVRAMVWGACVIAVAASGCSVLLDWDVKIDAGLDPAACQFKEPNDTVEAPAELLVTETGPAAICVPGDLDFYRFAVTTNSSVTITIAFDTAASQDLDLQLYDPSQGNLLIGSALTFGSPEETLVCPGTAPNCPPLPPGDYVLEVLGGSPQLANVYTLSITITP